MIKQKNIFNAFNDLNVLIIGDIMIDRYLTGRVDRISPEAPVPIVALQKSDNRLGGAANVALNLAALGARPFLCSVIGADDNGQIFLDLLPRHHLSSRGVIQSPDRITTVKTRVMADGQQLLRVDDEMKDDLTDKDARALVKTVKAILAEEDIHVVIFQDYNKGVLTLSVIREIIAEVNDLGIPITVDPKFNNFWAYEGVSLFKPNLKEIKAQLPDVVVEVEALKSASDRIREKLGNAHTLITLSEQGLFYADEDDYGIVPTQPRSIADVCGAGDSVISIVSLGLALGMDLKEVALLANLAGGQVCEKVGVVPVDKRQLEREYEEAKRQGRAEKVM